MNLTDKEKRYFKATIEGILKDLHGFTPYQQGQMPLNNRKYTYSYTQYQDELYITHYKRCYEYCLFYLFTGT